MRVTHLIPLSAAFAALVAAPSAAMTTLHLNQSRTVQGVQSACTGVGYSSEHNPRWDAYPLKIVLDGQNGQYLGDDNVSLIQGGRTVVSVHCNGPWVLFKPQPGDYTVVGGIGNTTETAAADVKKDNQDDVILNFPHKGGATSAQNMSDHGMTQSSG